MVVKLKDFDFQKILYDLQVCRYLHLDLSDIIQEFAIRVLNKHTYSINIYFKSKNKILKNHKQEHEKISKKCFKIYENYENKNLNKDFTENNYLFLGDNVIKVNGKLKYITNKSREFFYNKEEDVQILGNDEYIVIHIFKESVSKE